MHVVIHDQRNSFQVGYTTVKMLMQMYLCVAVFTVEIVFNLIMQELNNFVSMLVHFNLVHQRVKSKVKCRLRRRRHHQKDQGVRKKLRREYKQQTHVFAFSCSHEPLLRQRGLAYRCVL